MPINIWDVEWYNQNSQRNYPLTDEASRTDISGGFVLPNDFIVDFRLVVHAKNIDPTKFFVSSVSAFTHGYVITINYDTYVVGSVSILTASHTLNKAYTFNGRSDSEEFFDCVGSIVIGTLDTISQFGGSYDFTLETSRINPALIIQDTRSISGIKIRHAGGEPSRLLQGDVVLQAGNNISLHVVDNNIIISAVGNTAYTGDCTCAGGPTGACITSINGVGPDANGNVQLSPAADTTCLGIEPKPAEHRVEFSDNCSEPCCGCEELELLTREVQKMRDEVADMEQFANALEQSFTQLQTILAIAGGSGDL